jgi:di/tricarboxylate transporter
MKKTIYFRLILYILFIVVYRVIYLVAAFLMGFGSASDHTVVDIVLNVVLISLNILTYYIIQRLLKTYNKGELLWISILTLFVWISLYFYYS